jgi:hypothetical protein
MTTLRESRVLCSGVTPVCMAVPSGKTAKNTFRISTPNKQPKSKRPTQANWIIQSAGGGRKPSNALPIKTNRMRKQRPIGCQHPLRFRAISDQVSCANPLAFRFEPQPHARTRVIKDFGFASILARIASATPGIARRVSIAGVSASRTSSSCQ